MTRRKLVAGNWKMNGSLATLAELDAITAAATAHPDVDVAVAVPFTLISPVHARVPALAIGAQDVHEAESGAHTGCVSAASPSSGIANAAATSMRPATTPGRSRRPPIVMA